MSQVKARQLRIAQQVEAVVSSILSITRSYHAGTAVQDAELRSICEQLAACCRSLGLSSQLGSPDFAHLARFSRCAFALLACLLPVGSGLPAPRPRDVELVACLLRSEALLQLSHAIQSVIPPHTGSDIGPCACCFPAAAAWMQLVPFEAPISSGSGASTSSSGSRRAGMDRNSMSGICSTSGTTSSSAGPSTSSKQAGSVKGSSTKQLQRVSVAVAIRALLQRQLALVTQFCAWLECAVAAAATGGNIELQERLQRLLNEAGEQLLLRIPETFSNDRHLDPLCLAQYFCYRAFGLRAPGQPKMGRLGAAIPCMVAPGVQYQRLVMLSRAVLTVCLQEEKGETWDNHMKRCTALLTLLCQQVKCGMPSLARTLPLLAGPPAYLPAPHELMARKLRAVLWAWRQLSSTAACITQDCTESMAGTALAVLTQVGWQAGPSGTPSEQEPALAARAGTNPLATAPGGGGSGGTTSSSVPSSSGTVPFGPSPAVVAAFDCVAALAVDGTGITTLKAKMGTRSQAVLLAAAVSASREGDTLFEAGAGRWDKPRCAVSAALGLLTPDVHCPGSNLRSLGRTGSGQSIGPQQAARAARYLLVAQQVAPTLQRVLQPLACDLKQQDSTAGRARVLAGVVSPADIAAALTAAFSAVCGVINILWGWTSGSTLCKGFDADWAQLLDTSTTITGALADWLCGRDGCSGGVDTGSSSSSGGSSNWGLAHEGWRFALQEFKVCSAASKVLSALRHAMDNGVDPHTFVFAATLLEMLQPPRLAVLSATLLARLAAQMDAPAGCQPPAATVALLQSCKQRVTRFAKADLVAAVRFVETAMNQPPSICEDLTPAMDCEVIHAVLRSGSTPAAEAAHLLLSCPEGALLPWLLCSLEWRDSLLRAAQSVTSNLAQECQEAEQWAQNQMTLFVCVLQQVWQLPVQLARWVAAASGQQIEVVLTRTAQPFASPLDAPSSGADAVAASTAASTSGNMGCVREKKVEGVGTVSIDFPPLVLASFPAVDRLAQKVASVFDAYQGPDQFGHATRSEAFRALWQASGQMCALLLDELQSLCDTWEAAQSEGQAANSDGSKSPKHTGCWSGSGQAEDGAGPCKPGGRQEGCDSHSVARHHGGAVLRDGQLQRPADGMTGALRDRCLLPLLVAVQQSAGANS